MFLHRKVTCGQLNFRKTSSKDAQDNLMEKTISIISNGVAIAIVIFSLCVLGLHYFPSSTMIEMDVLIGNQLFRLSLIPLTLLGVLILMIGRKWIFTGLGSLVLFLLIVEGLYYMPDSGISNNETQDPDNTIRVMTFNGGNRSFQATLDWIRKNPVDIVCLQEVPSTAGERIFEEFVELGYQYDWRWLRNIHSGRIAILVRGEVENSKMLEAPSMGQSKRRILAVDAVVKGRRYRVFCHHLESPLLRGRFEGIYMRSRLREEQAAFYAKEVTDTQGMPVIVAGDFNATPTSRTIRQLRSILDDSWLQAGNKLGGTWKRNRPYFRIDAILHSGFSGSANCQRIPIGDSDHLAYLVDLIL